MSTERTAAAVAEHLDEAYLTDILVRLLQAPTDVPLGETELSPEDPKLAHYTREVVAPELRRLGFERITVDAANNLVCRIGPEVGSPSLLLMGYAVAQHGKVDRSAKRIATAAALTGCWVGIIGSPRFGRFPGKTGIHRPSN